MSARLKLHVPGIRDMEYRQKLLMQPETMSYNRGLGEDIPGYDNETGCIDFPKTDWRYWRDVWLWREPERFSAYLLDEESGEFVGEGCYYYDMEADAHSIGVVIEHCHRGKGYGTEAVKLLTARAMAQEEVECLCVTLPVERESAVRMTLAAGFREEKTENESCRLVLTREAWERSGAK